MASSSSDGGMIPGLALDRYRRQIKLDELFQIACGNPLPAAERAAIVTRLLDRLVCGEGLEDIDTLPAGYESRRRLLRALLNIRPPQSIDSAFVDDINRLLQDETNHSEITDGGDLPVVSDALRPRILKNADRLVDLFRAHSAAFH